jgi:dTDP-4-dehydrorhamnose 3,5-epimerase
VPFEFERLDLPDVILIRPRVYDDPRGFFLEAYKYSDFAAHGIGERFVQDNYSHSTQGVLRGLHFQRPPAAQGKLVMALGGDIFDVAVDLRAGSPTYLRWVSARLSAENLNLLYVPPGFAHGFCVLSETADVVYKVTAEYDATCDAGLRWDDPAIGICWPVADPRLSDKDSALPLMGSTDPGFVYHHGDCHRPPGGTDAPRPGGDMRPNVS